jgi:hypothetical protein
MKFSVDLVDFLSLMFSSVENLIHHSKIFIECPEKYRLEKRKRLIVTKEK